MLWRPLIIFSAFQFFFSLCLAEKNVRTCGNGTLKLSLIGTKNRTGKWNIFYNLDREFCELTNSWRLVLVQNATLHEGTQRIRLSGVLSENVADSVLDGSKPIYFDQDEGESREKSTAVIASIKGVELGSYKIGSSNVYFSEKYTQDNDTATDEDVGEESTGPLQVIPDFIESTLVPPHPQDDYDYPYTTLEEYITESTIHKNAVALTEPTTEIRTETTTETTTNTPTGATTNPTTFAARSNSTQSEIGDSYLIPDGQIHVPSEYNTTIVVEGIKSCTGSKPEAGGFKIVSRASWKARDPKRSLESFSHPVKSVYVTQTNVICPPTDGCAPVLRRMQDVLIDCFGDVYSNFYIADGGRTYEGLGWDRARSKDALYLHFLTDGWKLPSPQTMASFALLLWDGVRTENIDKGYELIENRHLTKSFQRELKKWVGWSKDMWGGY